MNDGSSPNGKSFFIEAFFEDVGEKVQRVERIANQNMPEEAITLACCYMDYLASQGFDGRGAHRENFVRFLLTYSSNSEMLRKISRLHVEREGEVLNDYVAIRKALEDEFGPEYRRDDDMGETDLIQFLRARVPGLDELNLRSNLRSRFSYAAVLYKEYRNPGVHEGGMAHAYDAETGRPVFLPAYEPSGKHKHVYYRGRSLRFSIQFILHLLSEAHRQLANECMEKTKFPHEL